MAEYYNMSNGNVPIAQNIQLSNRAGEIYGTLNNVTNVVRSYDSVNADEISFTVHKYMTVDSKETSDDPDVANFWDDIKDLKLIYLPIEKKWFEITVSLNEESVNVTKSVTGVHLEEAELSQLMLYEVEINTVDEDMLREDYQVTTFYNPSNPSASLLNRILADKAPHYVIHHVDQSLYNVQRSFSFDGTSILDALNDIAEEVQCLFVYGEASVNGSLVRSISAYDLLDYCQACGERGEDLSAHDCPESGSPVITKGYGNDTTVFVSVDNLAESIDYETDVGSYKNCFRLEGGDDLITATVANCNPNGSSYVWYFSDDIRNDMSSALQARLSQYDADYDSINTTADMQVPQTNVDDYNTLVARYPDSSVSTATYPVQGYSNMMDLYYNAMDLYGYLNVTMMPAADAVEETTAADQAALLTNSTMSPIGLASVANLTRTTKETAIKNYAKVYIDTSVYSITVVTSSESGTSWSGYITITSMLDDSDTANTANLTIAFNNSVERFIKQKMEKALARADEAKNIGIVALFEKTLADFRLELKKYSLTRLASFYEACEDCLDVMVEAGFASSNSQYTGVYSNMYQPYINKQRAIIAEIAVRDGELAKLQKPTSDTISRYYTAYGLTSGEDDGLIDVLDGIRQSTSSTLDLENYLGSTLWAELSSFRRDDTYSNNNFSSYDNMSSSELIKQAQDFYSSALKEIKKAGTMQHSISANVRNLFVMPEFEPIRDKFELMNWIRLEVDGKVYKLRLTKIEVEDDDFENADVEFSDTIYCANDMSDIQNVLDGARSMSTSYDEIARQAEKGDTAKSIMNNWIDYGLSLTNQRIVGNADNQNVVYDSNGILLRRLDEFSGEFDNEQVKIINKGLYFSDDNWETAKTGIGEILYVDPVTNVSTTAYGVNAETIVGGLILGETLSIYNQGNSLVFNGDGLTLTNGVNTVYINPNDANIFKITKITTVNNEEVEDEIFYTTSSGDATLKGAIYAESGKIGGLTIQDNLLFTQDSVGGSAVWINGDNGSIYTGSINYNSTTGKYYCGTKGVEINSDYIAFNYSGGDTIIRRSVIASTGVFSIVSENAKIFSISNGHNELLQCNDLTYNDPYVKVPNLNISSFTGNKLIMSDSNGRLEETSTSGLIRYTAPTQTATINAEYYSDISINLGTQSGFTPIGILGVKLSGSINIALLSYYIDSSSTAIVRVRNNSTSSATITCAIRVLWRMD